VLISLIFIMKNICVIYNQGSYGTFVHWCLNYFTDLKFNQTLPFNSNGNSHKFDNPDHLYDFSGCKSYVNSDLDYNAVRFHLRVEEHEDVFGNLTYISENFKKIIFLHCTEKSIVWNMNNKFEKIWTDGWLKNDENIKKLIKNWGDQKTLDTIEVWELRECLSLFYYDQHVAESDLLNVDAFKNSFNNCQFVDVEELRDSFEPTIKKLIEYCELDLVRNDFSYVFDSWIALQKHKDKDKLVANIIDATLNKEYLEWPPLTLVDEAVIQYLLRKNGFEIKCYNINIFPTNSTELNKIIYEIT
jgi:hypothetical protein